jgi:GDPmannose 4,6-dehydratase
MNKRAIISGINGQDGAYLTQYLLSKDYEVHGIIRRNSVPEHQTFRLNSVYEDIKNNLHYGDLTDFSSILRLVSTIKPHEIYNLGAQSHVGISFDSPLFTTNTIVDGTINLLESIRSIDRNIRFYQASSSEMFGNQIDKDGFQRESTPMVPVSPYGAAKLCAFHNVQVYRKSYNIFASNGILFNHESPFRGVNFVTNKIVRGAVMIHKGIANELRLGNLEASRDWGHAKDYVRAMHSILNHSKPDDFVCASGETHTVQELCNYVFDKLDISKKKIIVDEKFLRPNELFLLKGDPSKIKKELAWEPEYSFISMIDEMIEYWIEEIK